jgi:hypothetical protein
MDSAVPFPRPTPPPEPRRPQIPPAEQVMRDYVGYLAGWFDIGQLAAGRRLERSGVREPLLKD